MKKKIPAAPVMVTMTLQGEPSSYSLLKERRRKKGEKKLSGLFYLSPVATCSSVFYLGAHSNWTTFGEKVYHTCHTSRAIFLPYES